LSPPLARFASGSPVPNHLIPSRNRSRTDTRRTPLETQRQLCLRALDSVLAQPCLCLGSALSQPWLCLGSVLALSWLCLGSVLALSCLSLGSALSQPCLSLGSVFAVSCVCLVSDLSVCLCSRHNLSSMCPNANVSSLAIPTVTLFCRTISPAHNTSRPLPFGVGPFSLSCCIQLSWAWGRTRC
jgi:hypothetical protein